MLNCNIDIMRPMTKPKNQVDYKVQLKPVNVVVTPVAGFVSETEAGRDGSTTVVESLVCIWLLDSATVTLRLTLSLTVSLCSSRPNDNVTLDVRWRC